MTEVKENKVGKVKYKIAKIKKFKGKKDKLVPNNNKITFKTKFLKDKIFNINDVFSPLKVYNHLNKIVDEYYQNLDFNKVNKDEYKKLIIHLIYYSSLFPQDIPKGVIKFLIYCLKTEH